MNQNTLNSLEKLRKRLANLTETARANIETSLKGDGAALVTEMQRFCPADSGDLRASIHATTKDGKLTVTAGDHDAPYAKFVEFGTRHAHAKPFFMPAYRSLRAKIIGDTKQAVTRAVKDSQ